jgi:hypothetical protein
MKDVFGISLSIVIVALMVYAVALFITSGAGKLFYAVVIIDLIISFFNAWMISTGRYEKVAEKVEKGAQEIIAPTSRKGSSRTGRKRVRK